MASPNQADARRRHRGARSNCGLNDGDAICTFALVRRALWRDIPILQKSGSGDHGIEVWTWWIDLSSA